MQRLIVAITFITAGLFTACSQGEQSEGEATTEATATEATEDTMAAEEPMDEAAPDVTDLDIFVSDAGLAIKGYDPVAYQKDSQAKKGSEEYAYDYGGATFYFASEENMKLFKESPEQYMPASNGYCAFATAAMKKKVPADPTQFKVLDGKTYLFYTGPHPKKEGETMNAMKAWEKMGADDSLAKVTQTNWEEMKGNSEAM